MRWDSSREPGDTLLWLEETGEAGRYLVASQDVPPGALLLEELPLAMLPSKQARRGRKAGPFLYPIPPFSDTPISDLSVHASVPLTDHPSRLCVHRVMCAI